MNEQLAPIISLLFINSIYLLGKFFFAIQFGVHEPHLFLGYGKHPALTFKIKALKVSIGLFIPLPFLAKFYAYQDEKKERIKYEWEFFDIAAYKRVLVIYGGSLAMLLTSMVIFSFTEYFTEDVFISKEEMNRYGIYPSERAKAVGLKIGDKILSVNGKDFERSQAPLSPSSLMLTEKPYYEILRGKDTVMVSLGLLDDVLDNPNDYTPFFSIMFPFEVSVVSPESNADLAGIQSGDRFESVNGKKVTSLEAFGDLLKNHAETHVDLIVIRDNERLPLKVLVDENGLMGFSANLLINYTTKRKGMGEAVLSGVAKPFSFIRLNIVAFVRIFGGELSMRKSLAGPKSLNGPISIAKNFGGLSYIRFFTLTGVLLLSFIMYDIFPFPKSATLKAIPIISELFGKRFTINNYNVLHKVFWIIIILLMALVIFNDISQLAIFRL